MKKEQTPIRFDSEADILYINLAKGEYSHSIRLSKTQFSIDPKMDSHMLLDIGEKGDILGVEVQAVSQIVQEEPPVEKGMWEVPLHLLSAFSRNINLNSV
ncbi:MAG: DUF2283 domain-containing protein [Candidatus Neomarinimicrobiota bacterium]